MRNFAARFNTLQLEQETRSLETAQLEFQDAVDAKDAEVAKRGKPKVRKLNSMTREELCYSGADRRLDAEQRKWLLAPHQWKWRWCRPRDGSEQRKWLLAPHQRKWPLMQVKKDPQQKWLLAPHQWKLLLMYILPKNQDPEADGWPDDKFSLAPTDPEAPPMSVGHWAPNKMSGLRRRDLHRLVQQQLRAWMRRLRA